MTLHTIEPERRTLHGHFSRDLTPVLTIESGDTVRFRTLDAGWGLEPSQGRGVPRRLFEPRDEELDRGHAMCGPVAIRGARPGMTLEVRVDALRTGGWGTVFAGGTRNRINHPLGLTEHEIAIPWELDDAAGIARSKLGHQIALRPFMGVMGMPPAEPGVHSTTPPRPTGGNIDCKELVVGSSLFLPIAVPDALFSVGDGHGVQGDGEASQTAIECPMERVDLTFTLHEEMHLTLPRASTPVGWLTFGFDEDLDVAMVQAVDGMLGLMGEQYGFDRYEALALASLVVDLRITQVVNQVSGVHAVLPHGAISR